MSRVHTLFAEAVPLTGIILMRARENVLVLPHPVYYLYPAIFPIGYLLIGAMMRDMILITQYSMLPIILYSLAWSWRIHYIFARKIRDDENIFITSILGG